MKYAITGSAGHISKPLVEKLLSKGHEVTVIGRNAANLAALVAKGAKAAIGSIQDVDFLIKAFAGADAVYTMSPPPDFAVTDWKASIAQNGKNYAKAIRANNIKYVVNLSSVGGHMPQGAGPVSGLYYSEQALNALADVNIKHLRPGYFYPNFFTNINLIKNMNIMGSNFGGPGLKMVLSEPDDIADIAAEELLNHNFTGHSVRYVVSDERTTTEVAHIIGEAIGKPDLPWVIFSDQQALDGMLQAGLPAEIATNYVEMGNAFHSGIIAEDYWRNHPRQLQKTKLEDFAKVFAAVYKNAEQPVH